MKRKNLFRKFTRIMTVAILAGALMLSGCAGATSGDSGQTQVQTQMNNQSNSAGEAGVSDGQETSETTGSGTVQTALSGVTSLDVNDMFSKRDQNIDYNEAECVLITLNGDSASCESAAVSIENNTVIIKEAGSYILRGTLNNGSVRVEAPEDAKVQLILDGVTIMTKSTACVYVKTADKVFVTLAEGSNNTITNTGDFVKIDDNNIDGAIFSKSDLTLNGKGVLQVSSEKGHGIVSKDDLKITGGTYDIQAGDHGISGKDSIRIADGTISITCAEDGLHSGNDEDADKGYVYIQDGNITIHADDDGIHGETKVVIAGGIINIAKSYEGIEAAIVEVAGGDITVNASDDGMNATDGSGSEMFGGPGGFDFGEFGGRGQSSGEQDMQGTQGQQDTKGRQDAKGTQDTQGRQDAKGRQDTQGRQDAKGTQDKQGRQDAQGTAGTAGAQDAQGKSSSTASDVYILISGGKLVVNARGDGLDANGSLYLKGGEVYVSGPENSGNGALDYDKAAEVTGGTLIAIGSTGMAMNFSSATQGSALLTLSSMHNSGETVTLTDSKGDVLISYVAASRFQSVVVTSPEMKQGETYILTVGSEKQEFTLDELIYGKSNGFGGGGFGGNMPNGFNGQNGDRGGRSQGGKGQKGSGQKQ